VWWGLHHAGTKFLVAQLGAHLQAALAEQFKEKHNIIELPVSVVAGKGL
jgi:hypothetical protein